MKYVSTFFVAGGLGLALAAGPAAAAVDPAPAPVPSVSIAAQPAPSPAQHPTTKETSPKPVKVPAPLPKPSFIGVPIPLSNPAVGSGVTVIGAALYEPKGSGGVWTTGVGGVYTSSKSWALGVLQKSSFMEDRFRLTAGAGYGDFNLRFYGIGALSSADRFILINQRGVIAYVEGDIRVAPHTYIGPVYRLINLDTSLPPFKVVNIEIPVVQLKSVSSSAGVAGLYDTRDSEYGPSRGIYGTAQWVFAEPVLGSTRQYNRFTAAVNGYFRVTKSSVLAARLAGCATSQGAPFYDICLYGMNNDLRGYSTGQYRDPKMIAAQLELRQHLFWKFGMVVLGGVGGIAPGPNSFGNSDLLGKAKFLPAGGAGLRFMVSPQYKVNLAVDYAVGDHSSGLYIGLGEAF